MLNGNEEYLKRFAYDNTLNSSIIIDNIHIESDRLYVRPISRDDINDIFVNFNNQIASHMYYSSCKSIDDAKQIVSRSLEGMSQKDRIVLTILNKDTHEFLGCLGIFKIDTTTPEIGFSWIKKKAQQQGYFNEATIVFFKWILNNINFNYICLFVDEENEIAHKILKSWGAILGERLPPMVTKDPQKILNVHEYRLYKEHLNNILSK